MPLVFGMMAEQGGVGGAVPGGAAMPGEWGEDQEDEESDGETDEQNEEQPQGAGWLGGWFGRGG